MKLAIVNPKPRKRRSRRRKASSRRRARVIRVAANPKRRRRKAAKIVRRRRRGGGSRSLSFKGVLGQAQSVLKSAAPAAAGALALDVIWGYLPLPENVRTGYVRHAAKFAGALGIGIVAERVLGRDLGAKIGLGAATVVLYNVFRDLAAQFAPGLTLGYTDFAEFPQIGYTGTAPDADGINGFGEYQSALSGGGDYGYDPLLAPSLGEYVEN